MTTQPFRVGNKAGYLGLAAVAVLTFIFYAFFGCYYATRYSDRMAVPGDLSRRGDAYLSSFGSWNTDSEGDSAFYNRTALGVLQTGVPRQRDGAIALYAPVYSYFLAACYGIGGVRQMPVAIGQALVAALLAWWLGLAARRVAPQYGPGVMWLAAGMILINLPLAAITAVPSSPTLLVLLWVSLALYAAAGPLEWRGALGFTGAMVLGVFTQAAFFVVALPAAFWLFLLAFRRRQAALWVATGLVLAGVAANLFLATAAARQVGEARQNKFGVLWEANNPYYESMGWTSLWGRRPGNPWSQWQPSAQDQARFDDYLKRARESRRNPAVLWILENPVQYAKLCWIRFYTTLGPFTGQMSPRNRLISTCYWLLIYPAGCLGLWRLRRMPLSTLGVLVFLAITVFSALVITEWALRYRLPWNLILTLFATVTYWQWLNERLRPASTVSH